MFVKYSIGGSITSIKDKDGIDSREESTTLAEKQADKLIICGGCGIQHALFLEEGERKCSCGRIIKGENN